MNFLIFMKGIAFPLMLTFILVSCNQSKINVDGVDTDAIFKKNNPPQPLTFGLAITRAVSETIGSCVFTAAPTTPTKIAGFSYKATFDVEIDPTTLAETEIVNAGTGGTTALTWSVTSCGDNKNFMLTAVSISGDGTIIPTLLANSAETLGGDKNAVSTSVDNTVIYQTKVGVTVEQKVIQPDAATALPIEFDISFAEKIDPTTFTIFDITQNGTATGITWDLINSGDDQNFTLTATDVVSEGTLIPSIAVDKVSTPGAAKNAASTSTDNSVTYSPALTVSIEQAVGQIDPDATVPVEFAVDFNVAIDPASLTLGDFTLGGTATDVAWELSNSGNNRNYILRVINYTDDGTVNASLGAGLAQTLGGQFNPASTSLDNEVTLNGTAPSVTVNKAITEIVGSCNFTGASDYTNQVGTEYRITFSKAIDPSTFTKTDIVNSGTGGSSLDWTLENCGDNKNFLLRNTVIAGEGTVVLSINANTVQTSSGSFNVASTSLDNTFTFDITKPNVMMEQAVTQVDPTGGAPVEFRVVFSEPVDPTSFTAFDVTLDASSTASVNSWNIINSGDNQTFKVQATSVSGDGTIIPNLFNNSIKDMAGNFNNPATYGADNQVSINTTIIASPTIEQQQGINASSNSLPVEFSVYFNMPVDPNTFTTADITQVGTAPGVTWEIVNSGDNQNFIIKAITASGEGTIIPSIGNAQIQSNTGSDFPSSVAVGSGGEVSYDTSAPTVLIQQKSSQQDPTASVPVRFDVMFSEPIDTSTFTVDDIFMKTSATGVVGSWNIINSGDDQNFTLEAITVTTPGTIIPQMQAGKVYDKAGNGNTLPAYGSDNEVLFDNVGPIVTINQHPGGAVGSCSDPGAQPDYTNSQTISFLVNFSKPINTSTFDITDVTNQGTGGSSTLTWGITSCGDNQNYLLQTSVIDGGGTIEPYIDADLVKDTLGNFNSASTSSDGSVLYSAINISVNIEQHPGGIIGTCADPGSQADPVTTVSDIYYTVTFDNPVNATTFTASDILNEGTGGSSLLSWNITSCGDDLQFVINTTAITGDGTIVPVIAADSVSNPTGSVNTASTSIDNSVDYRVKAPDVTIEQYAGGFYGNCVLIPPQSDPAGVLSIFYLVEFDEVIDVTTFTETDITNSGLGGSSYLDWRLTNCGDNRTFLLEVSNAQGDGAIIPGLPALAVKDLDGNDSNASFSIDNSVYFDATPPNLTIEQHPGGTVGSCPLVSTQIDYTLDPVINFLVTFSEEINPGSFLPEDIANLGSGGAGGLTWSITNCGDNKNFKLTTTNIDGGGEIIPFVDNFKVFDVYNNGNFASTSVDNVVKYDQDRPTVTVEQYAQQGDPTAAGEIRFQITFSEAIDPTTFVTSDFLIDPVSTLTVGTWVLTNSGDNTIFYLDGSNFSGTGLIKLSLPEGSVQDFVGWNNFASTSVDNEVTVEIGWYQEAYLKAINGEAGDEFGLSVDIDSDTLVIGAPDEDSNQTIITNGITGSSDNSLSDSGAAYIYKRTGGSWTQEAYLKAANAGFGDRYGEAVAVSGDTVVIGAPYEDAQNNTITNGTTADTDNFYSNSGAIFVYKRSGGAWAQEAYIKASNNDSSDYFGRYLEIDGDTIVAGIRDEDSNHKTIINGTGTNTVDSSSYYSKGVIVVYRRTGVTWAQEAFIGPSSGYRYDYFGESVSVSGDLIAVGSPGEDSDDQTIINGVGEGGDNNAFSSGAVHIYVRSGATWSKEAYIKASNSGAGDSFGSYVSIRKNRLAVSSPGQDGDGTTITMGSEITETGSLSNSGAVYLFERVNGIWSQEAYVKTANLGSSDGIGRVALGDDLFVIGVPEEDSNGNSIINGTGIGNYANDNFSSSGAVYVYEKPGNFWVQNAIIKPLNNQIDDNFGYSVAIDKNTIVVGAPYEDSSRQGLANGAFVFEDDNSVNSGAAYVYRNFDIFLNPIDPKISYDYKSATLSWDAAGSLATGYKVAFQTGGTAPATCDDGTSIDVGNVLSYVVNGLVEQSEYSFRVCSYKADGTLSLGRTFTITTPISDYEVGKIYLSSRTRTSIELSWVQGIIPASGYIICYLEGTTYPDPQCATGTSVDVGLSYSYNLTGINPDSTYSFRVLGYDSIPQNSLGLTYQVQAGWHQEAMIKAVNAESNDAFGASVALGENIMVVGATGEDASDITITNGATASLNNSLSNSGAVYVYSRVGDVWTQEAYIKASNTDSGDAFGVSVSIDKDTIVVGANGEDALETTITNGTTSSASNMASDSGAAYVYRKVAGNWQQEAYIKPSNSGAGDDYGSHVDISGDTIVVNAPGEDSNQVTVTNGSSASSDNSYINSGAIYVFKRTGTTWAQEAFIKPSNSESSEGFGSHFDLDGNVLAVGSPNEDSIQNTITSGAPATANNSLSNSGAVYIFSRSGTSWFESAFIKSTNNESSDQFGKAVALSGDTLAVGAVGEDSSQTTITNGSTVVENNLLPNSGAVYVYKNISASWQMDAYIKAENAGASDSFGSALDISGDTLVVGAPSEDSGTQIVINSGTVPTDNLISASGAVYTFKRTVGGWVKESFLKASNSSSSDSFGSQLSLNGDTLIVGVSGEDSSFTSIQGYTAFDDNANSVTSGAVYVFRNYQRQFMPTGFAIKSDTGTDVTLTWSKVNFADGYKLAYQTGTTPPFDCNSGTNIDVGDVDVHTFTGLTSGTDYSFRLCGYGVTFGQDSGYTLLRTGTPNPPFPDNITSLTISNITETTADLSWTAAAGGVTGYKVAYKEGPVSPLDCNSGTVIDVGNVTSYTLPSLLNFDKYSLLICSYDAAGFISSGVAGSFNTPEFAHELSVPYIKEMTDASLTLAWSNTGLGATGFFIAYQAGSAPENCQSGTIVDVGLVTEYTITGLTSGTEYGFRLCSYDGSTNTTRGFSFLKKEGWYQSAYFKAVNRGGGDNYGSSISMSGDTLAIAAPEEDSAIQIIVNGPTVIEDDSSSDSGSVYVYRKTGDVWTQEAYVKAFNNGSSDNFGHAVEVEGDTLVVSAPGEDSSASVITNQSKVDDDNLASNSGSVYVYKRTGSSWSLQSYIKPFNTGFSDSFGTSLSLSGDRLLVGATGEDSSSSSIDTTNFYSNNSRSGSGAAYLFKRTGSSWSTEAFVKVSLDTSDAFGSKVFLKNDQFFVSALGDDSLLTEIFEGADYSDDDSGSSVGVVYAFKHDGTKWIRDGAIKPSNSDNSDAFGTSISFDGGILAISAKGEDGNATVVTNGATSSSDNSMSSSGAVYVYEKNGSSWEQKAYLKPSNTDASDNFGTAISVEGGVIAVGAPGEDSSSKDIINGAGVSTDNSSSASGAVYLFQKVLGNWQQTGYLKPGNIRAGDSFGTTVEFSEGTLAVGATGQDSELAGIFYSLNEKERFEDATTASSGAVYLFSNGINLFNPTNVLATVTDTQVDLTWKKMGDATAGFKVAYLDGNTPPVDCNTGTVVDVGSATTFSRTGLLGESYYSFRVCSYDVSSNLSEGTTFIAKTNKHPFDVNTITLVDRKMNSIRLSWTYGGAPIEGFKIAYSQSDFPPADCSSGTVTDVGMVTNYEITGLLDRLDYSFRVCGYYTGIDTAGDTIYVPDMGWYQEAYIKPGNNSSNLIWDFGAALAVDGDTVVATVPEEGGLSSTITDGSTFSDVYYAWGDVGAAYVFRRTGSTWAPEAYLKPFNTQTYMQFGWDVDVDGERIAVGAPLEWSSWTTIADAVDAPFLYNDYAWDSGGVHIYKRTGTTWTQEAHLKSSNKDDDTEFGNPIALDGDTIAIGANDDDHNQTFITNGEIAPSTNWGSNRSGSVYVFQFDGADWKQQAYIKPSNNESQDNFGDGIALNGDTLAVGASLEDSSTTTIQYGENIVDDNNLSGSGAVYIFQRIGSSWFQEAYLKAPNAGAGDNFGYGAWGWKGIGISGDRIVVGVRKEDSNQNSITNGSAVSVDDSLTDSGAVYVFRRQNSLWAQEAYIKPFNPDSQDYFGTNVAISGNRIAVGAYGEDGEDNFTTNLGLPTDTNNSSSSGAVYIYNLNGGLWEHEAFIKASNAEVGADFGYALDLSGDTLVVNSRNECHSYKGVINSNIAPTDDKNGGCGAVYVYRNQADQFTPTKVKTVNTLAKSITLRWKKRPEDAGYRVDFAIGPTAPTACNGPNSLDVGWVDQHTFTGLQHSTLYSFSICAYDSGGALGKIQNYSHKTLIPPQGPLSIVANDIKTTSMLISWTPLPDLPGVGYRLAYKTGSTPPVNCSSETNLDVGSVNSFRVSGLISGNSYSFRVCPYDLDSLVGTGKTVTAKTLIDVWYQESYIKVANGNPSDFFGKSIDIYADTMIVGAPLEDSNLSVVTNGENVSFDNTNDGSGAAYIFRRDLSNWTQEAYLKAPNNNSGDNFGASVAIYRDIAAVSAPLEDSNATTITNGSSASADNSLDASGGVYVFVRNNNAWVQEAYIKSSASNSLDEFGFDIDLHRDTLVIGAYREDSNVTSILNGTTASLDNSSINSGAVYVYRRTGTSWSQEAYIKAVNSHTGDIFGHSVSLEGDSIAVGAPKEDASGTIIINGGTGGVDLLKPASGAVYVYVRSGSTWSQQAYIKAPNSEENDYFGFSLDLFEDRLAIGATREDSNQTTVTNGVGGSLDNNDEDSGAVYVFSRSGGIWSQEAYLKAGNGDAKDNFGFSVHLGQNTLVVGAPGEDANQDGVSLNPSPDNNSLNSGAAYVYRRVGTNWFNESFLKPINSDSDDRFGHSVAMSGDTIIIGAPEESSFSNAITNGEDASSDNSSVKSGAVYVYRYVGRKFDPVIFDASNDNQGDIYLKWTRLAFAYGYRIAYQNTTPPPDCNSGTIVDVGNIDNFTVTGLTPGQLYGFRVCGYDEVGSLAPGKTVTWTKLNPPPNPSGLMASVDTSNQITLSWTSGGGATTGFKIAWLVGDSAPASCNDGTIVDVGNVSTAPVTGFSHYSKVSFRLCAYNGAGTLSSGITTTEIARPTGWYQEANLVPTTNYPYDLEFCDWSLGFSGERVICGSGWESNSDTTIVNGTSNPPMSEDDAFNGNSVGAAWIFKRSGDTWFQEAYLKPQVGAEEFDAFGKQAVVYGDVAAIYAYNDDSNFNGIVNDNLSHNATRNYTAYTRTGGVHVFRNVGGVWQQEAYIKPKNPTDAMYYGENLALTSDTLVVGVQNEDSNTSTITNGPDYTFNSSSSNSGAVYVYRNKGEGWYHESFIKAANPNSGDGFGGSIAIDGDLLVVGSSGEDSSNTTITNGTTIPVQDNVSINSGAAYVYRRIGDNWQQEAFIKASNNDSYDEFGKAVDVQGDFIVVSAPREDSDTNVIINGTGSAADNNLSSAGAVYVYKKGGSGWEQDAYIKLSTTKIHTNWYSYIDSVSIHGDTLVIGDSSDPSITNVIYNGPTAPLLHYEEINNYDYYDTGAAFVYRRGASGWYQEAYIKPSNAQAEMYFGAKVKVQGDTIAVDAPYSQTGSNTITNGPDLDHAIIWTYSGSVYIFRNKSRLFEPVELRTPSLTQNALTLSWKGNVGNGTGFIVAYQVGATAPANCSSGTFLDVGNVEQFSLSGLAQNTKYSFRVCSYNGSGQISSGVVFNTKTPMDTKNPTNVIVRSTTTDNLVLDWTSSGGGTAGFQIAYVAGTTPPADCTSDTVVDVGNVTSHTITGLTTGTQYSIRLCAYNGLSEFTPGVITDGQVKNPGWNYAGRIKQDNAEIGDDYGYVVDLNENTLVVGAPKEDSSETTISSSGSDDNSSIDSGAVYVYAKNGNLWEQQAYLKAENGDSEDYYGYEISLYKDKLAVSAPFEDSSQSTITNGSFASSDNSNFESGAVYIYKNNAGSWSQEAYIKAVNNSDEDNFGVSISLGNNLLIVGAPGEASDQTTISQGITAPSDNLYAQSGAAYLYSFDGTNWAQEAFIKADNRGISDKFGSKVLISGIDTLVISAFDEDSNQSSIINGGSSPTDNNMYNSGAIYIYRKVAGAWQYEAFVKAYNNDSGDLFGQSIAIDNDTLVVGSSYDQSSQSFITNGATASTSDNSSMGYGSVFVYRRTGSNWAQEAYIKPVYPGTGDYFGKDVAISGNTIVVGAPFEDSNLYSVTNGVDNNSNNSLSGSGAAFIYRRSGTTWAREALLKSPFSVTNSNFGTSVAIHGDTIVVGSLNDGAGLPEDYSSISVLNFSNSGSGVGAATLFENKNRLFEAKDIQAIPTGATTATLSWQKTGGSGVGFQYAYDVGTVPPVNCSTATDVVDVGDTNTASIIGLSSGTTYSFRLCSYDSVPTLSDGAIFTITTP